MQYAIALVWAQWALWLLWMGLLSILVMERQAAGLHSSQLLSTDLAVQAHWDMLELTMAIPKREFGPGEAVEAHLTLENHGDAPVALVEIPFQMFDLVVYDDGGRKVWGWTETRVLPLGVPGMRRLMHGEALGDVLAWDQTLSVSAVGKGQIAARGTYFLEGLLKATLQHAPSITLRTPRLAITLTARK